VLGRHIEVMMVITNWEPPSRFTYKTISGPAPGEMAHYLSTDGMGTALRVVGRVEIGGLVERLAGHQIEKRVEEDAHRMKVRLESRG
jgi:carbon monoxide dehydrogenase subunit G